jgi:hypothetical protein
MVVGCITPSAEVADDQMEDLGLHFQKIQLFYAIGYNNSAMRNVLLLGHNYCLGCKLPVM